jgi:hypothetical protein
MSANRVEKLVYWYLRFNGYLTIENFTVHPDFRREPETEADILAVRFPQSKEEPEGYKFERDSDLVIDDAIDFIIGEAKSGKCAINQNSWGNPERRHVQYALEWMGFLKDEEIESVAEELYQRKVWKNKKYSVRFVCFGHYPDDDLKEKYPELTQLLLDRLMNFVFGRLTTYCNALHRENWDPFICRIVERIQFGLDPDRLLEWVLMKED